MDQFRGKELDSGEANLHSLCLTRFFVIIIDQIFPPLRTKLFQFLNLKRPKPVIVATCQPTKIKHKNEKQVLNYF